MGKVAETIEYLRSRAATMPGDEMEDLLLALRFDVKPSNSGKHYVVTHDELDGFLSSSFDKGHKKQMLSAYTNKMRKLITNYKAELEKILGEDNVET